jgi:DNA polymerase kappa
MSSSSEMRAKLRATAEELEKDMLRTQFKGRTLCLKIKLHTYEVFTRQTVLPKAIYQADDLYRYSVPMLSKLEQEFPGMKLRLLGLRCTHLVSMKKPDTMAFFGFKRRATDESTESPPNTAKRKAITQDGEDDGVWEQIPDELLFEDAERQEREDELQELESLSQEIDKRRHHGKEIVPNPKKEVTPEEEWWDCPICSRPQPANERELNEHIDLCLSRQTIRDVVQETAEVRSRDPTPLPAAKKVKMSNDKNRGNAASGDPRQRKLFFGNA